VGAFGGAVEVGRVFAIPDDGLVNQRMVLRGIELVTAAYACPDGAIVAGVEAVELGAGTGGFARGRRLRFGFRNAGVGGDGRFAVRSFGGGVWSGTAGGDQKAK